MSLTYRADHKSKKYGKWHVLEFHPDGSDHAKWLCECECGNRKIVSGKNLSTGKSKSCGCVNNIRLTKHGKSRKNIYKIWSNMIARCTNKNSNAYKHYGAKGINICQRWLNSFENFYSDMGDRPKNMQLDRIDNNKGYSPENCRWVTCTENQRNKSNTKIWVINGNEYPTLRYASKILGISRQTVKNHCEGPSKKDGCYSYKKY